MLTVSFIIALVLALLLWLDSARAREMAHALCSELCRRRGLQLLDDSVALARMAPRMTTGGVRLRRMFRFEYSIEGVQRHVGYIILVGGDVERIDFGLTTPSDEVARTDDGDTTDPARGDDKVVPFRRKR